MLEYLRDFNLLSITLRLVFSMLVGGAIGLERGRQGRAAGMRTHILVCIGATLTTMIGLFATQILGYSSDPMRISAQVISGIGFLGVGTILTKGRFQITGLTTAAGLWATAAIGLALGAGFYEGALISFIIAFLAVTVFHKIEFKVSHKQTRFGIYVEISSDAFVRSIINHLVDEYSATGIQVTSPRSGSAGNVGIEANISSPKNKLSPQEMSMQLEELEYVIFAIESV